jgi:16S rRNA (cytosine967-C5)-methyltransferase
VAKTSREIALEVLTEIETKGCFADEVLNRRLLKARHLETKDKNLLFELVKGTLRWRGRVDYFLDQHSKRPLVSVPIKIKNTLRLGAYQILFLDRVPDWAAVDQAAELARHYGHEGHVRFVNGILRNLIRNKEKTSFPDPSDTVQYLATTHSFPEWLVERWVKRFGAEDAEKLLRVCNLPPLLSLRVNTLEISQEAFLNEIRKKITEADLHPLVPDTVEVLSAGDVTELPGFNQGWFYVQDPGAILVSHLAGAQPGERVLDACAAPGGKASHLAQLMEDRGEILALEIDQTKIRKIRENMERLGIRSVRTQAGDAANVEFSEPFDRIMIDAPCSGLGTIRRHPEAKWQKREEDLTGHQERQLSILKNISRFVRKGGSLVYATCSTEPEENEEVIEKFLKDSPEFAIDKRPAHLEERLQKMFDDQGFFRAWPHLHGTDGFFAVRMIKISNLF